MLQCKTSVSTRRANVLAQRHRGVGVIAALGLVLLAGCGQKGPLTLPSAAAPASAPVAK